MLTKWLVLRSVIKSVLQFFDSRFTSHDSRISTKFYSRIKSGVEYVHKQVNNHKY
jgi:hypothetical protein